MAVRRVSLVMVLLVGLAACSRSLGTPAVCGDGELEPPETCDGDCPVSCDDGDPCTVDTITGDASSCDVRCTHDPIVDCLDGDGCCAPGCHGLSDSDCVAICGNGVTESPETCDGDCPADCDDLDACTVDLASGGAATCDVVCAHDPVVACQDGDGCCPGGGLGACHALNDDDCLPVCGNGVVEPPETCDDGNAVAGDGCGPTCLFEICGNGYVDVGEICDDGNTIDGDGCSANCLSDETCGNGYVDTAVGEECDDGNAVDWDGCTGCAISEFQVNTYTLHSQMHPAVAMAPDGRFVVVWMSYGQDGSYDGVYAQRFDAQGNPLGRGADAHGPGEVGRGQGEPGSGSVVGGDVVAQGGGGADSGLPIDLTGECQRLLHELGALGGRGGGAGEQDLDGASTIAQTAEGGQGDDVVLAGGFAAVHAVQAAGHQIVATGLADAGALSFGLVQRRRDRLERILGLSLAELQVGELCQEPPEAHRRLLRLRAVSAGHHEHALGQLFGRTHALSGLIQDFAQVDVHLIEKGRSRREEGLPHSVLHGVHRLCGVPL